MVNLTLMKSFQLLSCGAALLWSSLTMGAWAQRAQNGGPFREYSWKNHPTQTLRRLKNRHVGEPVIMHKYVFKQPFRAEERYDSENGMFAPGGASYRFLDSSEYFCKNADVLFIPFTGKTVQNELDFATIKLTRSAFVYVMLALDHRYDAGDDLSVTPLTAVGDWGEIVGALEHESFADKTYIADASRWDNSVDRPNLRRYAVAVNVTQSLTPLATDDRRLDAFVQLKLPHPRTLRVNNRGVVGMYLVMSPAPYAPEDPLGPHPYPRDIGSFTPYISPTHRVFTSADPPVPNKSCPSWLHDIYVVGRGGWWQTWHPPIDPIYWCYFDHEHGGYPGLYLPRFHYTAYHTFDPTTSDHRQDESHNGFKVMPFIADDGRVVVMVLHAHMSNARRFHARHHTFMFSVHNVDNPNNWEMEMDLYMKADFGPLRAINSNLQEFLPDQVAINEYMEDVLHQKAERDTYIWDPDVVGNYGFWVNEKQPCLGRYEEWRAPINCAYNDGRSFNSGLKFEFHEQQTAMKDPYCTSSDNLERMCGDGMKRSVVFVPSSPDHAYPYQTIYFGEEHCNFGEPGGYNGTVADGGVVPRNRHGVFFTDAYFTKVIRSPATYEYGRSFALRQYIKRGFKRIMVGGKRALTNENPWVGIYSYAPNMVRSFSNMERAIDIWQN